MESRRKQCEISTCKRYITEWNCEKPRNFRFSSPFFLVGNLNFFEKRKRERERCKLKFFFRLSFISGRFRNHLGANFKMMEIRRDLFGLIDSISSEIWIRIPIGRESKLLWNLMGSKKRFFLFFQSLLLYF